MARRAVRKITRKVKVARRQEAINSVILTGIEGGTPFRNIAKQISRDFYIDKDKALKIVMAEFKKIASKWLDLDKQTVNL